MQSPASRADYGIVRVRLVVSLSWTVAVLALEADLRWPMSSPHPAHRTLEALGSIRTAATPAVPTIIALLDRFNGSEGNRIPYVCASLRTLTSIAPQSPEVIGAARR